MSNRQSSRGRSSSFPSLVGRGGRGGRGGRNISNSNVSARGGRGHVPNQSRPRRTSPSPSTHARNATSTDTPPSHRPASTARPATQSNLRSKSNPSSTPKRDGEKGASSHTVSESNRMQLDTLIYQLRESTSETRVTLPPDLTNTQRKYVHELAKKLGLSSKSYGRGEDRRVVVSKVDDTKSGSAFGSQNNDILPIIHVGQKGKEALRRHWNCFPPTEVEAMESRETGSSFLKQQREFGEDQDDGLDLMEVAMSALPTDLPDHVIHSVANDDQQNTTITTPKKKETDKLQTMIHKRIRNHQRAQKATKSHPQYMSMMAQRRKLPAFEYAEDICAVLRDEKNQVVILTGDTGCGKSTQVPQFLLDDPHIGPTANILITQPRRISAISVAERVASERCETAGQSVGYSVRLETSVSQQTQLLFVTPGVLMRRLQPKDDDNAEDERLAEFTHIIMDEIHERDKNTEFLMIALQEILEKRDNLKLILMSATMPTRDLADYWCGVGKRRQLKRKEREQVTNGQHRTCVANNENKRSNIADIVDDDIWGDDAAVMPTEINIPGRTFPVQEFFLEDVLTITGFVDAIHGADAPDMVQMEKDIIALLNVRTKGAAKSKKSSKDCRNSAFLNTAPPTSLSQLENTLTCVMCNQSGFKCAEEFGTHVAFCDGGGNISMEELESRVRSIDMSSIRGFDDDAANSAFSGEPEALHDIDDIMFDIPEGEMESYDDDIPGLLDDGKWNGESRFIIDNQSSSSQPTLTEAEMLTRYQTMFDDEEINYDLILELLRYIVKSSYGDGAVLIFFPGWAEISEFSLILESTHPFSDSSQFIALPLHSGIPSKDQRQVFLKPPVGVRKIILATNIAETSLTIEDVAFVIDTGRAKEKSYDPHLKTSTLQESWISQASAKQRRGRAGRCKAGVCFHLFTRRRYSFMRPFVESELLRTPLEEICLQCKRLKLASGGPDEPTGIPIFLSKAMTPPHPKSVLNALELLVDLGAMDEETNDLTDLGCCLSALSLEPRVGKMVIMSNLLGCSRSSTLMATAMSYKSPFALPPPSMRKASDQAKVKFSNGSESDQITSLNVLKQREVMFKRGSLFGWCRENFLNFSAINMISDLRKHASRELESLGFPPSSESGFHNRNEDYPHVAFHQAAICAGLYPNLAYRRQGDINFSTMSNKKAKIHVSSVNAVKSQPLSTKCQVAENEVEFILYGELVKGKAMFTMENTSRLSSPLPLILFCGQLRVRPYQSSMSEAKQAILSVDEWLSFLCDADIAATLVVLRQRLDSVFALMTSDPANYFNKLTQTQADAIQTLDQVIKFAFNEGHSR